MKNIEICIIGAGASGMMAAIVAARQGKKVLLMEQNPRVGKKLLATGNGKCNFSHRQVTKDDYYGSFVNRIEKIYQTFGVEETLQFFTSLGMMYKDKNGYLYPYSEQANTVLDVLRAELDRLQVSFLLETRVTDIIYREDQNGYDYEIFSEQKKIAVCKKIIIATGGMAAPQTGSDGFGYDLAKRFGIAISSPFPALTKFVCKEKFCKAISGVRQEAKITIYQKDKLLASEMGEVQFTDYGLSGIPVFQVSRVVSELLQQGKSDFIAALDLFPNEREEDLLSFCRTKWQKAAREGQNGEFFLTGMLPKKLSAAIGKLCQLHYEDSLQEHDTKTVEAYVRKCKRLEFHIEQVKGFDQAQVTGGGIKANEISEHFEVYDYPGLYFVGEVLDLDGKCGGYNLQWAWTSGAIAGAHAAGLEEII